MRSASNQEGNATIKRLIMDFHYASLATSGAGIQNVSVGVYVAGHEAFDQNALNDPESDAGQDWYYWTTRALDATGASSAATQWSIDLRTARLLRSGYKLLMVVDNPLNDIATVLSVGVRLLWSIRS